MGLKEAGLRGAQIVQIPPLVVRISGRPMPELDPVTPWVTPAERLPFKWHQ